MLKTVTVIEHDGLSSRAFSIVFEVPNEKGFDLEAAVRAAATDFCKTKEGRQLYKNNCECFNWADFDDVPDEFCEKHGFRRAQTDLSDLIVDWDEHLVDDDALYDDEDEDDEDDDYY